MILLCVLDHLWSSPDLGQFYGPQLHLIFWALNSLFTPWPWLAQSYVSIEYDSSVWDFSNELLCLKQRSYVESWCFICTQLPGACLFPPQLLGLRLVFLVFLHSWVSSYFNKKIFFASWLRAFFQMSAVTHLFSMIASTMLAIVMYSVFHHCFLNRIWFSLYHAFFHFVSVETGSICLCN